MSFALTTQQIRDRTKTVTRRLGWKDLRAGTLIRAVVKCQGLRKGEQMQPLAVLCVVDVRRERLGAMVADIGYGFAEVEKEGFSEHPIFCWPSEFVEMFSSHNGCKLADEVTRIEFRYVPGGRLE